MKLTTTVVLLFSVYATYAQQISNVNFDYIEKETTDSTSATFYPILLERYVKADTSLTQEELYFIYYGNVFSEQYNPYGVSDEQTEFLDLYFKKKYKKAIPLGEEALLENPVNLKITFKLLVAYHALENKEMADHYAMRYFSLLNSIYNSGDGSSVETAYVVINIADEYEILADRNLTMTSQALVGSTDVLTLDTESQKNGETEEVIEELYFNVSQSLGYLSRMFDKKDE